MGGGPCTLRGWSADALVESGAEQDSCCRILRRGGVWSDDKYPIQSNH